MRLAQQSVQRAGGTGQGHARASAWTPGVDGDSAVVLMPGRAGGEFLKAREIQVLELVAAGKANKEIAHELSTTEGTVKNYIKKISSLLHASDRTHAVVIGMRPAGHRGARDFRLSLRCGAADRRAARADRVPEVPPYPLAIGVRRKVG